MFNTIRNMSHRKLLICILCFSYEHNLAPINPLKLYNDRFILRIFYFKTGKRKSKYIIFSYYMIAKNQWNAY